MSDPNLLDLLDQAVQATLVAAKRVGISEPDIRALIDRQVTSSLEKGFAPQAAVPKYFKSIEPDLTLMTLGQIKNLYPNLRGVVTDSGLAGIDYLIKKYREDCIFKDCVEGIYGGDYFGKWEHYVDRHNLISV